MRNPISIRNIAQHVEFCDTYWCLRFEFSHADDQRWDEAIEYVNVDEEGEMFLDRSGDCSLDAFYPWLSDDEKKGIHDNLEKALAEILARDTSAQKRERREALLVMVAEIRARFEIEDCNASGNQHA